MIFGAQDGGPELEFVSFEPSSMTSSNFTYPG